MVTHEKLGHLLLADGDDGRRAQGRARLRAHYHDPLSKKGVPGEAARRPLNYRSMILMMSVMVVNDDDAGGGDGGCDVGDEHRVGADFSRIQSISTRANVWGQSLW